MALLIGGKGPLRMFGIVVLNCQKCTNFLQGFLFATKMKTDSIQQDRPHLQLS